LLPLHATLVASGAQPWILDQIAAAGVPVLRETTVYPPALYRTSGRVAPYNLYGNTEAMRWAANDKSYSQTPPPDLFRFGHFAYPATALATNITLTWSDPISVTWAWDGSRYLRSLNGVGSEWVGADGTIGRLSADNLLVLFAPIYAVAPPPGVAGSPVPALDTVGSGRLLLFTKGRVVEGTWSKSSPSAWFTFHDQNGSTLMVPPGVPWFSVFPADRPVTWD
jgi:hypothetical protein